MTFTTSKQSLYAALNAAAKAINPNNNVIPIQSCFLFEIQIGTLKVSGSNNEVFISKTISIDGGEKLKAAIPSSRLLGLVKELPEQSISFTFKENVCTIKTTSGKYNIPFEDGESFPLMAKVETDPFKMPFQDLVYCISKTVFAASNEEIDRRFTGIFTTVKDQLFTMVGCNKVILSEVKTEIGSGDISCLIPAKSLNILAGMDMFDCDVYVNERNISMSDGVTEFTATLMDEKYPDYKAIVPTDNPHTVEVDRSQLLGAIKRTMQFAQVSQPLLKVDLSDGLLSLSANNDMSEDASEDLPCTYNGEDVFIIINANYLLQCISKTDGEMVNLKVKDSKTSCIITGENEDLSMLAMPFIGK